MRPVIAFGRGECCTREKKKRKGVEWTGVWGGCQVVFEKRK